VPFVCAALVSSLFAVYGIDYGYVRIKVDPPDATVTVDGEELAKFQSGRTRRLKAGLRRIAVHKVGFETESIELRVKPAARYKLVVELAPAKPAPPPPPPKPKPKPKVAQPEPAPSPVDVRPARRPYTRLTDSDVPPPPSLGPPPRPAAVALSLGAVAAAAAVFAGVEADDAARSFDASLDRDAKRQLQSRAEAAATTANVLYGVSAVAVAVGLGWWLSGTF